MESSGDRGGDAFSSFLNPLESLDRGESAPGDDAGTAASGRVTPPLRGDTGGDGVVGEAKVLEKVGLAPQQLKIVYSRKRGSQH